MSDSNNSSDHDDDRDLDPPQTQDDSNLTDEQNQLVTQLLQVCSDETLESCKKALIRHNFNIDRAALELLSADASAFDNNDDVPAQESNSNPPTVTTSNTSSNLPAGPNLFDDNDDQSSLIPPANNPNPRVVHSDINNLRQRTIPEMLQAQAARLNQVGSGLSSGPNYRSNTSFGPINSQSQSRSRAAQPNLNYAAAARRNNTTIRRTAATTQNSSSLIPASIRNLFSSFFQLFTFPLSIFMEILSRIFPAVKVSPALSALTLNRNNLTPIQEVDLSIKSLQNYDNDYKTINFFRGSYNEVLSRCKSEAKYLLLYLHVPEHEDTKTFLESGNSLIKEFIQQNDEALIWTCRLDTREGAHVANELFIHDFPCLALLAPVSSARVSCIQQINNFSTENNGGWKDLLEAKENFTGELVLLKEEKRKRESDIRLRKEQEQEYKKAIEADLERQQVKADAIRKEEEKRKTITDKKNAIALAKEQANEMLEELPDLDKVENINIAENCGPTIKINVRMPNGSTMQKTFLKSCQIKHIRALILTNDQINSINFEIQSRFPNKTFNDKEQNLEDAFGNVKSQLLFIQAARDEALGENSQEEEDDETSSEDSESSEEDSETE